MTDLLLLRTRSMTSSPRFLPSSNGSMLQHWTWEACKLVSLQELIEGPVAQLSTFSSWAVGPRVYLVFRVIFLLFSIMYEKVVLLTFKTVYIVFWMVHLEYMVVYFIILRFLVLWTLSIGQ